MTVLIIHNHTSGDPTPSPDDHELTRRLAAAGVVMGIDLVDHIVLGDSRYCSFKEMGNLWSSQSIVTSELVIT
jgi:DNA repair protein RadC